MLNRCMAPITVLLFGFLSFCSAADHTGTNHGGNIEIRDEWQPNGSSQVCFYMTNDVNWQGEGMNICEVGGQCSGLLPDGLASNISSAGGDPGQTCFLYTAENCTGDTSAPIINPGYADLSVIGFLTRAVSWRCYKWCGYIGPARTATTTTLVTMTKTMSAGAANAAAVTHRDVSISTTLSGSQPTASSGSTSTTASVSATQSTSASSKASSTPASSIRGSALPPLNSTPAPISDSASISAVSVSTTRSSSSPVSVSTTKSSSSSAVSVSTTKSSSSSIVSVSTTLTSGTSSTTSLTTAPPLAPMIPVLSSSALRFGTGTTNASATSISTSWILLTHTYGGRSGSSTTLISVMLTGPAVPGATVTPASER